MPAVAVMPDVALNSPFRVIAFHSAQYAHAIAPYAGSGGAISRYTPRSYPRSYACFKRFMSILSI